jgi:hypothetical protein
MKHRIVSVIGILRQAACASGASRSMKIASAHYGVFLRNTLRRMSGQNSFNSLDKPS